jgi:hypothetical protein
LIYEFERKDSNIFGTIAGPGPLVRINTITDLTSFISEGDFVYLSSGVYETSGEVTAITSTYIQTNITYTADTSNGYINYLKNWYLDLMLKDLSGNNLLETPIRTHGNSAGRAFPDLSAFVRALLLEDNNFGYDAQLEKDIEASVGFYLAYTENYEGVPLPLEVEDSTFSVYGTDSVKQLQEQLGQNMGLYVMFPAFLPNLITQLDDGTFEDTTDSGGDPPSDWGVSMAVIPSTTLGLNYVGDSSDPVAFEGTSIAVLQYSMFAILDGLTDWLLFDDPIAVQKNSEYVITARIYWQDGSYDPRQDDILKISVRPIGYNNGDLVEYLPAELSLATTDEWLEAKVTFNTGELDEVSLTITADCDGDISSGTGGAFFIDAFSLTGPTSNLGCWLTKFEQPKKWDGYPFDLQFIHSPQMDGRFLYLDETEKNSTFDNIVNRETLLSGKKSGNINRLMLTEPLDAATCFVDVVLVDGGVAPEYDRTDYVNTDYK